MNRRPFIVAALLMLLPGVALAQVFVYPRRADRSAVNTFEFEDVARTALETSMFSLIAGGDRTPFERMTFRPRMFVPSAPLDLTTTLLGERMFAPFVVGPVSEQRRFHPDGELATVRGIGYRAARA